MNSVHLDVLSWARVGEGDGEESRISSNTTPDYTWFSGNRIITEGMTVLTPKAD